MVTKMQLPVYLRYREDYEVVSSCCSAAYDEDSGFCDKCGDHADGNLAYDCGCAVDAYGQWFDWCDEHAKYRREWKG